MRQKKMVPGKMIAVTKIHLPVWILTVLFASTFVSTGCAQSSTQSTAEAASPALEIIGEVSQTNAELADVLTDIYEDTKRFMDIEVALPQESSRVIHPIQSCGKL
ncbi:MAG: hypothetical protein WD035_01090 [Balneolaceae bacterium]